MKNVSVHGLGPIRAQMLLNQLFIKRVQILKPLLQPSNPTTKLVSPTQPRKIITNENLQRQLLQLQQKPVEPLLLRPALIIIPLPQCKPTYRAARLEISLTMRATSSSRAGRKEFTCLSVKRRRTTIFRISLQYSVYGELAMSRLL
ncbi:hypothetical protein Salat_1732300 [Sesamum alatum]|uniref:Uncharacterized protein n=1 Tax=Sesamum alatum TaxID=300844 RepID=A0AAE1Y978_9LAMI|nr:hypothetical protein Salat_1732300 [Sesamum alatum]